MWGRGRAITGFPLGFAGDFSELCASVDFLCGGGGGRSMAIDDELLIGEKPFTS